LLRGQCYDGRSRNVKLLLADPRVDVNVAHAGQGWTPLHCATAGGKVRCVEALADDECVDVNAYYDGLTPLVMACVHLAMSMDQVGAVGGNDPARVLVIMLKSRRITPQCLAESIDNLRRWMPTSREIHNAEIGGEPLTDVHKVARLVLPVLTAQARGHFRWCGHCLDLTPDQDLDRCGGCNQVGYCPLPYQPGTPVLKYQDVGKSALPAQVPCHKAHWKSGHKQECARFAAEAKAAAEAAEAAAAAAAEAAKAGAAGGGGGGGKKGGKKGKKNRRR